MNKHSILFVAIALATPATSQDAALITAAKRTLEIAQALSFETGSEHCGLLGQITGARYVATKPRRGLANSCRPKDFSGNVDVIASYHTHGSFDPDAFAEVPSSRDVEADIAEGVFGFVSTPGGRLWLIDPLKATATLLCGIRCLPQDPDFQEVAGNVIKPRYSLGQLRRRESGD